MEPEKVQPKIAKQKITRPDITGYLPSLKPPAKKIKQEPRWKREGWKPVDVRGTHWSIHERGESDYNFQGKKITKENIIACNWLPIGTEVYIPGMGYYIVWDKIPKGSINRIEWAMKGDIVPIIDIHWFNHTSAMCLGHERKYGSYLTIYVKQ